MLLFLPTPPLIQFGSMHEFLSRMLVFFMQMLEVLQTPPFRRPPIFQEFGLCLINRPICTPG